MRVCAISGRSTITILRSLGAGAGGADSSGSGSPGFQSSKRAHALLQRGSVEIARCEEDRVVRQRELRVQRARRGGVEAHHRLRRA
jgi:hypothetical protein